MYNKKKINVTKGAKMNGKDFLNWRRKMNYTQQQAADALNVKVQSIYRWENEKTEISKAVELACKYLLCKKQKEYTH